MGYKNKHFLFIFVSNPNNYFCNPKKKVGFQKGTGDKKEHVWVTKKNVPLVYVVLVVQESHLKPYQEKVQNWIVT